MPVAVIAVWTNDVKQVDAVVNGLESKVTCLPVYSLPGVSEKSHDQIITGATNRALNALDALAKYHGIRSLYGVGIESGLINLPDGTKYDVTAIAFADGTINPLVFLTDLTLVPRNAVDRYTLIVDCLRVNRAKLSKLSVEKKMTCEK